MQENQNCQNAFSIPDVKNEAIKTLFQLLNTGEIKFCNQHKYDEATLVLGNTGVGKTVFTKRIAGYGASLRSIEDGLDYTIKNSNSNEGDDKSYITSDTIFPELIKDNNTGAVYYDFPGFLDTRGAANDITTTYFIKKIVDNVKRVRMLLLINHTSLTNTGTRDDFINLLLHATKFVKNIDKYKDGIALIATKVQYPKKSDEKIISTIADFIKKAKNDLKQKENGSVDYTNVIKLLDIILQDGNMYPKIGISRSPDQTGLLSEIPIVQENTVKIKNKLAKIKFIEKNDSDFGYIIPKKSLMDIDNIMDEINRNAAASVREIGKEMQKYLSNEENRVYDISKLYGVTSMRYEELKKLREKANNRKEIEKCVQEIISGVTSMNIHLIHQNTLIMYGSYLSFLHTVSDHTINNEFKCADGLQDVVQYSYRSKKWYYFLNKLYERLSNYEIQSDTLNSPCTALAESVTKHMDSKKNAEFNLDPIALKKCYPNYESEFEDIRNVMVDKSKLEPLGKVLNLTLKSNSTCSCDSNKLVIKGQYVKLGDVPNIQKTCCRVTPKFTEIFALNEIFINKDLDKTGEAQLSIIAPVWDIQGARKITLDGESGKAHYPAKASGGTGPGDRGTNGMPGLPGRPGGNFLGIGETFKNLQGLTISVQGGKGGPGQNGGDGEMGRDGADAYDDIRIIKHFGDVINNVVSLGMSIKGIPKSDNHRIRWYEGTRDYHVFLAGQDGQRGGDGGYGGTHGLGGNSGKIIFAPLVSSDANNIHKVTGVGSQGSDGDGGRGAVGGKNGNHLEVSVPHAWKWFRNTERTAIQESSRAAEGNRGIDGFNQMERTYPEKGEKMSNSRDVLNEYKNYASANLERSVRELFLTQFLQKLESDARFQNYRRKRRNINRSDQTQFNVLMPDNIRNSRTLKALKPSNSKNLDRIEYSIDSKDQDTNKINHTAADDPTFAKNAGVRINSPINFAINSVSNFITQWKLFGAANVMNNGLVKAGLEFMFRDSKPSDIYTTSEGNTDHAMKPVNFNINESLALADYAIRCITKQKFYNSGEKSMYLSGVKASVLNIITEFEEILSSISMQYNLPPESLEFDPVALISKLEKEFINENYKKAKKILYQSIESNVLLDNPQSRSHMLWKIDEILENPKKKVTLRLTPS